LSLTTIFLSRIQDFVKMIPTKMSNNSFVSSFLKM
jgi:hypothetical protein